MKKLPGIIQIIGLLGCILLPLVLVNGLVNNYNQKAFYLLYLPLLLIPALACRLLFEGDESKMGKFFFKIGDLLYLALFKRMGYWIMDNARMANRWNRILKPQDKKTLDSNEKFIENIKADIDKLE